MPVPPIATKNGATKSGVTAVRARSVLPLAGERPAKGMAALDRPLQILDDAVIAARDGIITHVETHREYTRRPGALPDAAIRNLGDVLLVPGLANCHTHLEISHMAGKTRLGNGFTDWVGSLVALDREPATDAEPALHAALAAMAACGTACVGDIASRMPETVLRAATTAGVMPRIFCEIIGHSPEAVTRAEAQAGRDPAFSLAGHAFYTTPGAAMVAAKNWCLARSLPFSLHLAEHEEEVQCLRDASGTLYTLLRERVVPASWNPPGLSPVRYAASLGLLAPGTLAVHCVYCDDADIATLAGSGTAVCLCPRSNAAINVGEAPVKAMAEKGILLCLGTDSLASNADLDVWREAEFFLKKNMLPAKALLRMATVNGAAVLGMADQAGRLEKGMGFWYRVFPSEMSALFR